MILCDLLQLRVILTITLCDLLQLRVILTITITFLYNTNNVAYVLLLS